MRLTRNAIALLLVVMICLAGAAASLALRSLNEDESSAVLNLGTLRSALAEMPRESFSQQEREGLITLREGTKLAHDLYARFGDAFELPVFANNAFNAQSHTSATVLLIERYGLSDPLAGRAAGQFTTTQFRDLYATMRDAGLESEEAALRQAMLLEELGAVYVKNLLAESDNQDLNLVYTALLRGAALNLRDLVRANRQAGYPRYEPEHLTRAEFEEAMRVSPDALDETSLFLRASDFGRCGIDDFQRPARRQREEPPSADVALERELCSTEITVAGSATKSFKVGTKDVSVRMLTVPLSVLPAPVDSNSPAFWQNGVLAVFNSWDSLTYRSSGVDVENLGQPVEIQLPRPARPGNVWLEAVWRDPESSVLYGWYHLEPSDLPCAPLTAPIIGAAVSRDGGLTWQDRGTVLEAAYEFDCEYRNGYFVGGHGDFSVVVGPRGQHFYFLFSNYAGPLEEQGVAIARGPVAGRGQPGTVSKFYNGRWDEPGIGGKATALFPSSSGWKGPYVEAFWGPSVHWNAQIQSYVALLNHTQDDGEIWLQEGIYISFSTDLLTWTTPEKILNANSWYPQVLGLSRNGTDSLAERYARIYVGGISSIMLEFRP